MSKRYFSCLPPARYIGKTLAEGESMGGAPWYVYASGIVGLGLIGKVISDAANKAIGEYEEGE